MECMCGYDLPAVGSWGSTILHTHVYIYIYIIYTVHIHGFGLNPGTSPSIDAWLRLDYVQ